MTSMFTMVARILILLVLFHHGYCQIQPKSCADLYMSNIVRQSGEYTIYNNNNQPFQVYCEFQHGYGYTFISPATRVNVDIANLVTNRSHVLVRDRRKDGTQYEADLSQITSHKNTPLSIQYNTYTSYREIQNPSMGPYVYVGFIPVTDTHLRGTEGYQMDGQDLTFTNCDGNSNSYFVFLFNAHGAAPSSYNPTYALMQKQWIDGARALPRGRYLPDAYFSFFEMHFGGCGAYGTPQHLPQVSGAAVGLRYDISCPMPVDVTHATKSVSSTLVGGHVTYTCDLGYTRAFGDLTQTCSPTGRWTGLTPSCQSFPCSSHPCQNGGLCFEIEGSNYVCECTESFSGTHCEKPNM
ncbi:uncharacterized protein LOC127871828 [Dreissena polymorpha]|uniref:Sushi, nidogen and EGF-like domain-containing protein 1 n=1 Tax=Dreissena polymorpha TaxID=45954 RepID=A0A9D4MH35_DREPO|nr:uncharacterized protein LOC127871828 [Dreissena polymorpha]KAH3877462.1 hypothetical protein DPMN_001329 [Dreissena polymorpha]